MEEKNKYITSGVIGHQYFEKSSEPVLPQSKLNVQLCLVIRDTKRSKKNLV
jgi:hypothetical protein